MISELRSLIRVIKELRSPWSWTLQISNWLLFLCPITGNYVLSDWRTLITDWGDQRTAITLISDPSDIQIHRLKKVRNIKEHSVGNWTNKRRSQDLTLRTIFKGSFSFLSNDVSNWSQTAFYVWSNFQVSLIIMEDYVVIHSQVNTSEILECTERMVNWTKLRIHWLDTLDFDPEYSKINVT